MTETKQYGALVKTETGWLCVSGPRPNLGDAARFADSMRKDGYTMQVAERTVSQWRAVK